MVLHKESETTFSSQVATICTVDHLKQSWVGAGPSFIIVYFIPILLIIFGIQVQ